MEQVWNNRGKHAYSIGMDVKLSERIHRTHDQTKQRINENKKTTYQLNVSNDQMHVTNVSI